VSSTSNTTTTSTTTTTTDNRWEECDEKIPDSPIEALLCRTSMLNDASHRHDIVFTRILDDVAGLKTKVNIFGYITTAAAVVGVGAQLFKTLHG